MKRIYKRVSKEIFKKLIEKHWHRYEQIPSVYAISPDYIEYYDINDVKIGYVKNLLTPKIKFLILEELL